MTGVLPPSPALQSARRLLDHMAQAGAPAAAATLHPSPTSAPPLGVPPHTPAGGGRIDYQTGLTIAATGHAQPPPLSPCKPAAASRLACHAQAPLQSRLAARIARCNQPPLQSAAPDDVMGVWRVACVRRRRRRQTSRPSASSAPSAARSHGRWPRWSASPPTATDDRLLATGYRLPTTDYRLLATDYWPTSY
eukprot:COSAG01_NODE_7926_length_2989_cov_9.608651_3_plen_193_part_00